MARLAAGTYSTKFDQMTDNMTKEELQKLKSRLDEIEDPRLTRIDAEVSDIKDNAAHISSLVSDTRIDVNRWSEELTFWVELMDHLLHTKFFKFLNFFGKWVIYGSDDKVYPNIQKYRDYIAKERLDANIRGSTPEYTKNLKTFGTSSDSPLQIGVIYTNTGDEHQLYQFKGDMESDIGMLQQAIHCLDMCKLDPKLGEFLYLPQTDELFYYDIRTIDGNITRTWIPTEATVYSTKDIKIPFPN